MKVHQIKIDFHVTERIERYVYVYLVEGKHCYLIDSGVYGSEQIIVEYMKSLGRELFDLKGIFLTHAHPDHIGTAAWFKLHTGCKVYASSGEKDWIENIDLQFSKRPIPNFYNIAGQSVHVDVEVKNLDEIEVEEGMVVKAIKTPGHSVDEVSYVIGNCAFIGDSIPVKGDIPIYVEKEESIHSLHRIKNLQQVDFYYPAWDKTYSQSQLQSKVKEGLEIIEQIHQATVEILQEDEDVSLKQITALVSQKLDMPMLQQNPLFEKTVLSHCNELKWRKENEE